MINLIINNQKVSVDPGTTVLAAAKKLNINIPTLCNSKVFIFRCLTRRGKMRTETGGFGPAGGAFAPAQA